VFKNAEEQFIVSCELKQFDLSAHADRQGLFDIIRKTNPKQVIAVHGDSCADFAGDIEEEFNIQAFAPRNGETINV
jgi:putative mRNA 3-end processing factor